MTCFEILCIPVDATLDEAKLAYKRLVRLWHPDQYGNFPEKQRIAQDKLKDINVAYREVVAGIKRSEFSSDIHSGIGKDLKRQSGHPGVPKRKGLFWNRLAAVISGKSPETFPVGDLKKPVNCLSSGMLRKEASFGCRGLNSDQDFQKILTRAIHKHRRTVAGRPKSGNASTMRGRHQPRSALRSAATYWGHTDSRRPPSDRVEKINPVARINRIGGSD